MGGKVAAIAVLAFGGIILADLLIHPAGVKALGNATTGVLKPTYNALLGYKVK